MRLKCLNCCGWQENEVRLCPAKDCILWKYRMGKNPFPRKMTEETKTRLSKQLAKARQK